MRIGGVHPDALPRRSGVPAPYGPGGKAPSVGGRGGSFAAAGPHRRQRNLHAHSQDAGRGHGGRDSESEEAVGTNRTVPAVLP